jgi:choline/glycine/proline betaine transport protein
MFIARVSKGRTVREFVLAVLLVPSLISFFWLSAFGGSAVFLELEGMGQISGAIQDQGVAVALFKFVEELPAAMMPAGFWSSIPWAVIGSAIGVVLVVNFFITSSDSGSLVVDSLTSGGKVDAPVGQRIFWALTEGAVAAVLLYGSGEKGLTGLQTAVVSTGLPFAFVLLIMCVGLYQGLKSEHEQLNAKPKQGEAVREKAPAQH